MLHVIALVLVFQDGYLGGHTTAAYFHTKEKCEQFGSQQAAQYTAWGHPASFTCSASTLPKDRATLVR